MCWPIVIQMDVRGFYVAVTWAAKTVSGSVAEWWSVYLVIVQGSRLDPSPRKRWVSKDESLKREQLACQAALLGGEHAKRNS